MRTLEPDSFDDAAAAVAAAARAGERVVVRGGGTKSHWAAGDVAPPADIVLSTARLSRVVAHRHGDLTATIEAGAALGDVNRALALHGQWIPLDPVWSDRATIGGIVATNDAGPRRHRYGSPRDLIIGMEIARADGVRAKAGGIVVKNVAGYDLARLLTGSFGCLGVILSATFKLYPLPATSRSVVVDLPSHAAAGALVAAMNASQLTPAAVEIQSPPLRVAIRFESTEASVERQGASAAELAVSYGGRAAMISGDDEAREWLMHAERPWSAPGAVVKVTLLPADLAPALDEIERLAGAGRYEVTGRAGLGALLLRIDGDVASQGRTIAALRARFAPGRGSVVVLRGSHELKTSVDVWGPMGDAFRVMQAVKRAFDPRGTLNVGRGPGGL